MNCHNIAVTVERDVQSSPSTDCTATAHHLEEMNVAPDTGGLFLPDGCSPGGSENIAKSPPKTIRELEQSLREMGYTSRQAKAIASKGFKALGTVDAAPDEVDTKLLDQIVALVGKRTSIFTE